MNIIVQIPESIDRSLRVPEAEAEQRVREERAAALYARGLLSFGKGQCSTPCFRANSSRN
jgi:hypothetical protein